MTWNASFSRCPNGMLGCLLNIRGVIEPSRAELCKAQARLLKKFGSSSSSSTRALIFDSSSARELNIIIELDSSSTRERLVRFNNESNSSSSSKSSIKKLVNKTRARTRKARLRNSLKKLETELKIKKFGLSSSSGLSSN